MLGCKPKEMTWKRALLSLAMEKNNVNYLPNIIFIATSKIKFVGASADNAYSAGS
jgi:hypothetical protein